MVGCAGNSKEEEGGYSDEEDEEEEEKEEEDENSSFTSGIEKAIDEFDLIFDKELTDAEEKFDYFMSQSELS